MSKIDLQLDKLFATQVVEEDQNETRTEAQVETSEKTINIENHSENEIQDPERIQQKGRLAMPKRMKPLIEKVKEKMKEKERKKKKAVSSDKSGK